MKIVMVSRTSFGTTKVNIANYSRWAIVPKIVLRNLGIDEGDRIEWVRYDDGRWGIIPVKGEESK